MSLQAMMWVFENSPYAGGSRLVHLALADKANDGHDYELWMNQSKIGEMVNLSVNQVGRILKQMVKDGYLELVAQGGGRSKASRYRLHLKTPHIGGVSDAQTPPSDGLNPTISDAQTPPFPTSHLLLTQEVTQENATRACEPLTGFQDFWDVYPKRNGRRLGRAKCEVRWKKLDLDTRRAAWRGAVNYGADVEADLQISKDPERWLRDKLWTDWQQPTAPGAVHSANGKKPDAGRTYTEGLFKQAQERKAATP